MSDMNERLLWSDSNPHDPVACETYEEAKAIYNLYEDIGCLKEDQEQLKALNKDLTDILARLNVRFVEMRADNTALKEISLNVTQAYNDSVEYTDELEKDKRELVKALGSSNICLRDWCCTGGAKNTAQMLSDNSKLIDKHET